MKISDILKILDKGSEDWKLDMLTHITDYGIGVDDEPYIRCEFNGLIWYLDTTGIYAISEATDEL